MSFQDQVNTFLKGTNYSLKLISWNDVSRDKSYQTGLSSFGNNITDVKLVGKNNEQFYTIRSDNWNEKIGTVSSQDVAIITETTEGLVPMTLSKFLTENNLSSTLDDKVSIRFQTTFLPITDDDYGSIEFCTESYSYNTPDPSNPKNLLLLCTTQGLTMHTNKHTYQKLFLQSRNVEGNLVNQWLEAEETKYKVGFEQLENEMEVEENTKKGKASSGVIGIRSMGQRFNCLLTVQIPLKQKLMTKRHIDCYGQTNFFESKVTSYSLSALSVKSKPRSMPMGGISSAARVSKGSVASERAVEVDVNNYKRSDTEHITITVILYHVVKGGLPTQEDVIAAVTELDNLYASCSWSGNLKDTSQNNIVANTPVIESFFQPLPIQPLPMINRTTFPT